jgi:hypothetical protein
MVALAFNYCVFDGSCSETEPLVCPSCFEDHRELPTAYRHDHSYYCSYCAKRLDRYYDFHADGSFKSEDYRCIGCDAVAENKRFDQRKWSEQGLRYINAMLETDDLPIHIRQAYERNRRAMLSNPNLSID